MTHEYSIPDCGTLSKFYMDGMILAKQHGWRYGQALFNLLVDRQPHIAETIRATKLDPFHMTGPAQDFERWDAFAVYVEKNWYKNSRKDSE